MFLILRIWSIRTWSIKQCHMTEKLHIVNTRWHYYRNSRQNPICVRLEQFYDKPDVTLQDFKYLLYNQCIYSTRLKDITTIWDVMLWLIVYVLPFNECIHLSWMLRIVYLTYWSKWLQMLKEHFYLLFPDVLSQMALSYSILHIFVNRNSWTVACVFRHLPNIYWVYVLVVFSLFCGWNNTWALHLFKIVRHINRQLGNCTIFLINVCIVAS